MRRSGDTMFVVRFLGLCDEGWLCPCVDAGRGVLCSPPDALLRARRRRRAELHSGTLRGSFVLVGWCVSPSRRVADEEPVTWSFLTRGKFRTTKRTGPDPDPYKIRPRGELRTLKELADLAGGRCGRAERKSYRQVASGTTRAKRAAMAFDKRPYDD